MGQLVSGLSPTGNRHFITNHSGSGKGQSLSVGTGKLSLSLRGQRAVRPVL